MISEFSTGQKIVDFFVLRHKELRTKKDSTEHYLSLELGDSSGRIFGSLWNDVEASNAAIHEGQIIKVRGVVIDWHGKAHLSIDKIRGAIKADNVDIECFLPRAGESPSVLLKQLSGFIKDVKEPNLKALLNLIFKDKDTAKQLERTPGGKLWHHCYLGGLLEHTIAVVRTCKSLAAEYSSVNTSLLIAGAMLHDIGKIVEFTADGFFDYSDEGRLHGHISIGFHLVSNWIDQVSDFPESLKKELLHLILSHQGTREHGSPAPPMTREAFILNCADELDAKMGAFERIYEREHEPGKRWSNYVNLMDQFFYFGQDA